MKTNDSHVKLFANLCEFVKLSFKICGLQMFLLMLIYIFLYIRGLFLELTDKYGGQPQP